MNQHAGAGEFARQWPSGSHPRRRTSNNNLSGFDIGVVPDIPAAPTVVLVDKQPAIRRGVRSILERSGEIVVVGEASTADEAIEQSSKHLPDVLVIDLRLGGNDGIDVINAVLRISPETGVLVFSEIDDDKAITAAIHAGARGYLGKDVGPEQILRGVQVVAAGDAIISKAIASRFSSWLRPASGQDPYPFSQLTSRERDVLEHIAAGKSNSAIARDLSLAPKTISNRVSAIFGKLGMADRAQVIVLARDAGLGRG
jgi:DNA-binding NarL/FixJ family response regulator